MEVAQCAKTANNVLVLMRKHEGHLALYTAAVAEQNGVEADNQRAHIHQCIDELLDCLASIYVKS